MNAQTSVAHIGLVEEESQVWGDTAHLRTHEIIADRLRAGANMPCTVVVLCGCRLRYAVAPCARGK